MHYWISIDVEALRIEVDNEGFLLDPEAWTVKVAEVIAEQEDIELNGQHWRVINFVRSEFERNQVVPQARHVLKMLQEHHGTEGGNRKALQSLFPYGYGQQACKIAGMRKPLKLMLDV